MSFQGVRPGRYTVVMPSGLTGRIGGETRTPQEIRDAVYLFTGDVGAKQSRFWLLLAISTVIATAGIMSDSTATVIGAMIVAPLAIPIQGVGVAISGGEPRPLALSTAMVIGAALVVIALAAALAFILPELKPLADNSQVTGRVSPTLVDLVAAAATGLAGAFAVARRDIADILPGVAIAISLVPPLAVVGVSAEAAQWADALGALILFLTNVLAMIVVGVALYSGLGVLRPRAADDTFRRRPVYAIIGVVGVVIVGALAASTYRTVQLENWRSEATRVSADWARSHGERLVQVQQEGDQLVLIVAGSSSGTYDRELPLLLRGAIPAGTPVVITRVPRTRRDVGEVPG